MKHRLYSFVNHLYMSPIQWGIQTAHCVSTLSILYKHNTDQHAAYVEWAEFEPTIIVCQGGNVAMLRNLFEQLKPLADALKLPIVKFHEDQDSLGGVITAVAVLLPETLYEAQRHELSINEAVIAGLLGPHRGARPEQLTQAWVLQDGRITNQGDPEQDLLNLVKTARLA